MRLVCRNEAWFKNSDSTLWYLPPLLWTLASLLLFRPERLHSIDPRLLQRVSFQRNSANTCSWPLVSAWTPFCLRVFACLLTVSSQVIVCEAPWYHFSYCSEVKFPVAFPGCSQKPSEHSFPLSRRRNAMYLSKRWTELTLQALVINLWNYLSQISSCKSPISPNKLSTILLDCL